MKMYGWCGGIALGILNFGTRWKLSDQLHAAAALLSGKEPPVLTE